MENGFDFESGRLVVNTKLVHFNLDIRKPIVQIMGDSATGKSLLVNLLKKDRKSGKFNNRMFFPNVYAFDDEVNISFLASVHNCLIVIDRGDLVMTDNLLNFIVSDYDNVYMLFARRAFELGISPNYYGEFKTGEDGVIRIEYMFSERGWF